VPENDAKTNYLNAIVHFFAAMAIRLVLCLWFAVAEASLLRHRRRGLSVQCIYTESGSFCSEVDDDPLGSLNDSRDDDDDNSNLDSSAGESKDGLKPGATAALVLSLLFFAIAIGGCFYKRRGGSSHQNEDGKTKIATESKSDHVGTASRTDDDQMSTNKPENANSPWWGSRKSSSDTDVTSANEGKLPWWPSWMTADTDPKSAKKEEVKTPKTQDEIVEPSSSWWNACSIFK